MVNITINLREETEGIERRLQHNLQEMEDKEKELLR